MTQFSIDELKKAAQAALKEDLGDLGDITTQAVIKDGVNVKGSFLVESDGVLAGIPVAKIVFELVDENIVIQTGFSDGNKVKAGDIVMEVEGEAASILKAERTALNFLQHLSGIASFTSKFVKKVEPYTTAILDTRKTTPGLRALEKYAVRCGGGTNHRMGLFDAILIKDNHIAAAGGVAIAIERAKERFPLMVVEVETETLVQVEEALGAGADVIMLDNMTPKEVEEAVKFIKGRAVVEVSGGINLENVEDYAKAGADRISTSAITQAARPLNISLEISLK